jgi:hypothetical protein
LLRDGRPVTLPPKDLETLVVLAERVGHIVEKEELLEKVWPGAKLSPCGGTLAVLILPRARPFYSSRNVSAGSIFAILSVGKVVASSVTIIRVSTTVARVGASYTPTP